MSSSSRLKSSWHRIDQPKPDLPNVEDLPALDFVDLAYQIFLGRKAEPIGLEFHASQITDGQKTRQHFVYELTQSPEFKAAQPDTVQLSEEEFVNLVYQVLLGRKGNTAEISFHADRLRSGSSSRSHFMYTLYHTQEFLKNSWGVLDFWLVLHRARMLVACGLPKADRIVDLGGSSEGNPQGALLVYGYPYSFKSLSIVELPREQRHELYTEICGEYKEPIPTAQGPVNYVYASMTDLSAFEDGSIDLVYAGQSIEHVTTDEALTVLREVRRVLRPGGNFCFDTPNRDVTRFGFPNFIVDDHKYEYTHAEMKAILEENGFAVREAKGLVLMDQSVREGRFIEKEAVNRDRIYEDIENCFLLYYNAERI